MAVTSGEIKNALANKHSAKDFFLAECKSGSTWMARNLRILDGLAIRKSWTNPCTTGYEIKISRSDFLRDGKMQTYLPMVNELYLITPAKMIDKNEVSESIGLMWYYPETGKIVTKKKATWHEVTDDRDLLMYVIMCRLDSDRYPFHSNRVDYIHDWLKNKESDWRLGQELGSAMANRISELDYELERYSQCKSEMAELDAIKEVCRKHGIEWDFAKLLDERLSTSCPHDLVRIAEQISTAVNRLQSIIQEGSGGNGV